MLEILDFVKESLFMVLFVTFKINLLCERKKKSKKKNIQTNITPKISKKEDDEDITLNKYLFQKENEYKKQGLDKIEMDENLAIDAKVWEKKYGTWHDSH